MKIRNINPLGRVDVPLLRRQGDIEGEGRGCLEPGEVIDLPRGSRVVRTSEPRKPRATKTTTATNEEPTS